MEDSAKLALLEPELARALEDRQERTALMTAASRSVTSSRHPRRNGRRSQIDCERGAAKSIGAIQRMYGGGWGGNHEPNRATSLPEGHGYRRIRVHGRRCRGIVVGSRSPRARCAAPPAHGRRGANYRGIG